MMFSSLNQIKLDFYYHTFPFDTSKYQTWFSIHIRYILIFYYRFWYFYEIDYVVFVTIDPSNSNLCRVRFIMIKWYIWLYEYIYFFNCDWPHTRSQPRHFGARRAYNVISNLLRTKKKNLSGMSHAMPNVLHAELNLTKLWLSHRGEHKIWKLLVHPYKHNYICGLS